MRSPRDQNTNDDGDKMVIMFIHRSVQCHLFKAFSAVASGFHSVVVHHGCILHSDLKDLSQFVPNVAFIVDNGLCILHILLFFLIFSQ